MTKWRSMCQEYICAFWDQLPFLFAQLSPFEIEAPRVKLGLPGTTPDLNSTDTSACIEQVLAIRDIFDHLDALGTGSSRIELTTITGNIDRSLFISITVQG